MAFNLFDFSTPSQEFGKSIQAGKITNSNKPVTPSNVTSATPAHIQTAPDYSQSLIGKGLQWLVKPGNAPALKQSPQEILGNIGSGFQNAATSIKNVGYGDNTGVEAKQKKFVSDMLAKGYAKDAIFGALDKLEKSGEFQGSISENPITGTLASVVSAPLQAAGTMFGGESNIAGGFSKAFQGDIGTGASQIAKGTVETGLGTLGLATGFTPGGAAVNTAFSSETVGQPLEKYVSAPIRSGVAAGQEALGYNPQSEASKNIQDTAGTLGPLAVLGAGQKYIAPKITEAISNPKTVAVPLKKVIPTLPKAENLLVTQLEKTNRMNPTKYTEFEQMSGERAGKFLADRKITGGAEENVSKLYNNFTKSKAEADKGLAAIQKTYKSDEIPEAMNDMLSELQKRFTYTKDTEGLKMVNSAIKKAEQGILEHNDINAIKRIYERKVKVNYIKDQNSLEVERATNIDDAVRNWQFDEADKLGFSNLREINKETQSNRFLADNIGDKIARQAGLNNISLTDWIIAGQVPATPEALALLAGKKLAQNIVPKLYQKGLEKIANMPLKKSPIADIKNINKIETVRQTLKPKYDTNRLLVSPRNSSRSPTLLNSEVTLPKGERGIPAKKSPAVKSDITSRSKIVQPKVIKKQNPLDFSKNKKGFIKQDKSVKQDTSKLNTETTKYQNPTVFETPKKGNNPVKETPTLSSIGGIKGIEPKNQVKYNQGNGYEAVRMVLSDKDAQISRYGALYSKDLKSMSTGPRLTEGEKMEYKGIEKKLGMNREEILVRVQELKDIAKEARSTTEQVLVDTTKKIKKSKK